MAKWATKNPPKKEGKYLITVRNGLFHPYVIIADRYEYPEGNWFWFGYSNSNVIAWQKCPEPYKGE